MSETAPTIGVLIAAYNAAEFLDFTLAGVYHQILKPDRVVVVDDASTDATAEVARRWSDRLPLTVITNEVNQGVGFTRQAGASALDTDYIAVLDADDFWLPEHLLVSSRELAPMTIVSPRYQNWINGVGLSDFLVPTRTVHRWNKADNQLELLLRENFVMAGSTFSRELLERVGGIPVVRWGEDYEFWVRMVLAGARVKSLLRPTVLYRRHPDSLSLTSLVMEKRDLAVLERISGIVPASARGPLRHAARVTRARSKLVAAAELEPPRRRSVFRVLLPVLVFGPSRQRLSAVARLIKPRR